MRRLAILAAIALATSSCARNSAQDSVDQKTHKMCLQANDYVGCVKAQSGNALTPTRIITQQGGSVIEGNSCPVGYAYSGGGYCTNVIEIRFFAPQRDLEKYGWECEKTLGLCNVGHVDWGRLVERAFIDPKCPLAEPGIGAPNSCAVAKERKTSKLPMACRNGAWDKDHPKCQLPEMKIPSPMDID